MNEFEDASQEVLARLHEHDVQRSQAALDALIRAQMRRSRVLADMLQYLDTLDGHGCQAPRAVTR